MVLIHRWIICTSHLPGKDVIFESINYIRHSVPESQFEGLISGPTLNFQLIKLSIQFSSVTQSCLTLWSHGLQHAGPPCPSPTPRVHPNSSPLSRWCHPTISSSVVPFSSCPQSCPASGSFEMSQLFASDGQSIGVSASTSFLSMNTQDWSPSGWTGWIQDTNDPLKGYN